MFCLLLVCVKTVVHWCEFYKHLKRFLFKKESKKCLNKDLGKTVLANIETSNKVIFLNIVHLSEIMTYLCLDTDNIPLQSVDRVHNTNPRNEEVS